GRPERPKLTCLLSLDQEVDDSFHLRRRHIRWVLDLRKAIACQVCCRNWKASQPVILHRNLAERSVVVENNLPAVYFAKVLRVVCDGVSVVCRWDPEWLALVCHLWVVDDWFWDLRPSDHLPRIGGEEVASRGEKVLYSAV